MECKVFDLGLVDLEFAEGCQSKVFGQVKSNDFPLGLVLFQARPVITLGRRSSETNILKRGLKTYNLRRGGDVTYHGPGQIIVYPVFNLRHLTKDINIFLRNLEAAIILMLKSFSLDAVSRPGLTGVWLKERKISSIGVSFSNWISLYGAAINIKDSDLGNFSFIRPCGMDIRMTSLESELNKEIEIGEAKERLLDKFAQVFKIRPFVTGYEGLPVLG